MLHHAALILEAESRELLTNLESGMLNPSIPFRVLASQHVPYPPPRKNGMEGTFPPSCFSLEGAYGHT